MKLSQRGKETFGATDAVDISPYITTETTQNQFDALTSLATDIGIDAFRKSTLLKKHNLRCFSCAVAHFIVWGEKVGSITSNDTMCALCFDGGSPLYIRRDNSTVGSSSNSLTFTDDGVSLPAGWPNQATGSYFYAAFY